MAGVKEEINPPSVHKGTLELAISNPVGTAQRATRLAVAQKPPESQSHFTFIDAAAPMASRAFAPSRLDLNP